MVFKHIWGLFQNPREEWKSIRQADYSVSSVYGAHTFIFAAIPAISGYIGTTQFGWQIGIGEAVKLTNESAGIIAMAYFIAMLIGVYVVGYAIHWMSGTYCDDPQPLQRCVSLASYTVTPLFIIGLMEIFPILWLNLILGLPALAYTVFLFYTGVPVMFDTTKEKGFLLSTAMMGFGMVAFVALLAITALLWGFGLEPQFTS